MDKIVSDKLELSEQKCCDTTTEISGLHDEIRVWKRLATLYARLYMELVNGNDKETNESVTELLRGSYLATKRYLLEKGETYEHL